MIDPGEFLGKRWVPVGDGPDAFDCWGLTRAASRALFHRALPDLPDGWVPAVDDIGVGWCELPDIEAGAVIALGNYHGQIKHVCLALDHTRALNTSRESGSHIAQIRVLRETYPIVRFYQWIA